MLSATLYNSEDTSVVQLEQNHLYLKRIDLNDLNRLGPTLNESYTNGTISYGATKHR